jgi:hypothetical protein
LRRWGLNRFPRTGRRDDFDPDDDPESIFEPERSGLPASTGIPAG